MNKQRKYFCNRDFYVSSDHCLQKFTVLTGSHNADRYAASSVRTHSSNRSTCHAVVGRGSGLRVGGGDGYGPSRSRESVVWEPGCCGNPVSPSCDRTATTKPSGSGNHRASCPLAASRSGSHQHNPVFAAFGDRLAGQRPLASYRCAAKLLLNHFKFSVKHTQHICHRSSIILSQVSYFIGENAVGGGHVTLQGLEVVVAQLGENVFVFMRLLAIPRCPR